MWIQCARYNSLFYALLFSEPFVRCNILQHRSHKSSFRNPELQFSSRPTRTAPSPFFAAPQGPMVTGASILPRMLERGKVLPTTTGAIRVARGCQPSTCTVNIAVSLIIVSTSDRNPNILSSLYRYTYGPKRHQTRTVWPPFLVHRKSQFLLT